MASVRLGYCFYFLRLLLFFYTFQHPSPDSTTNSDRPIYRLNGQPKIGILLLFFTLAISFSINEYYLLYDTPLISWRIIQSQFMCVITLLTYSLIPTCTALEIQITLANMNFNLNFNMAFISPALHTSGPKAAGTPLLP